MTAITIVALQDPIAIVHIPVTSSSDHSTRLYWTLEHASEGSSEFFNITSNCIEVAISASVDLVNSQWIDPSLDPSIKISQSSWRVFEISSGDQGETGNYDSPHLRHVSAPLAKAGITILYQSSYFTDFLLVKEADFDKAAAIFAEQGWNVDRSSDSSPSRRRSQLLSPMSPEPSPEPYSTSPTRSASDHSPPPEITVLSSPLACIGFSRSAEGRTFEKIRQLVIWPRRAEISWKRRSSTPDLETSISGAIPPTPTTSGLPTTAMSSCFHVEARKNPRPFLSYTRTVDGSSLISSVKVLRDMFGAQKEGEVLELNEEVYFGDGDLFESSDESLRSGWDSSDDEDAAEPSQARDEGSTSTPRMSPRRSPRRSSSRTRPLSLPVTPRDSPFAGITRHDEIPIHWSSTDTMDQAITLSPKRAKGGRVSWIEPAREDESDTEGESWHGPGIMRKKKNGKGRKRCLQLDLRGVAEDPAGQGDEVYHMDKSGLVTLFSNLLNSANIRMLYSSTFHTANILVDAGDVRRAKKLLSGR